MYEKTKQMTSKAFSKTSLRTLQHLTISLLLVGLAINIVKAQENVDEDTSATLNEGDELANPIPKHALTELMTRERSLHQELANDTPNDEHVWLDIKYPGAAISFESLALAASSKAPLANGAAIILPDTQQHADWPVLVKQLRNQLPFKGWYTLSINLPWPELNTIPARDSETKTFDHYPQSDAITKATMLGSRQSAEKKNQSEASSNEETLEEDNPDSVDINLTANSNGESKQPPYIPRALVHVQAGMDYLSQQGYQNIAFIAIGKSAELAVEYLQSRTNEISDKGFALILIRAHLYDDTNKNFAKEIGESFPAPILDIVESNNALDEERARLRQASARVGSFSNYQQLKVANARPQTSNNFILKRISDWLDRYAPGQTSKI